MRNVTLTKLATDAAVTVNGKIDNNLALEFADAATDHTATLTMDNTTGRGDDLGASVNVLTISGVETLNIRSAGLATGTNGANKVSLANASTHSTLSKVVITGDQAVMFETRVLDVVPTLSIDASAASGFVELQGKDAIAALTIKGGTGGTKITGGDRGDLITLATNGSVDTLIYTEPTRSRLDLVNPAGTNGSTQDEIVNFTSGVDKIGLSSLNQAGPGREFVSKAILAASEIGQDADTFFTVANVSYYAVAATLNGDTYLVVDLDNNDMFEQAHDLVVKLTGVSTLTLNDLIAVPALPD